MSKSFVTLEQRICVVTGKKYNTDTILLDKRLRDRFDMHTVTGWGFSPEVEKKFKEGYVALVEVDESKSDKNNQGNITPSGAYRLGNICYIKKKVLLKIVPTLKIEHFGFCSSGFLKHLSKIPIKK